MEWSGVDVVCFQLAGTAARVLRAGRAQLCEFVQRDCAANTEAGAAEAELSGGHLVAAQRATARARGGALLPRAAAAELAVAIASVGRARDAGGAHDAGGARAARLLRQDAAPALGALLGAARQRVLRAQPQPELHACRSAPCTAAERSCRRRLGALAARERRRARRHQTLLLSLLCNRVPFAYYAMSAVARSAFVSCVQSDTVSVSLFNWLLGALLSNALLVHCRLCVLCVRMRTFFFS